MHLFAGTPSRWATLLRFPGSSATVFSTDAGLAAAEEIVARCAMAEPRNCAELQDLIGERWDELNATLARLSDDELVEPGADGWSIWRT